MVKSPGDPQDIDEDDTDSEFNEYERLGKMVDNDHQWLLAKQMQQAAQAIKYFEKSAGEVDEMELDKESLFTASLAMPMVAWSSKGAFPNKCSWSGLHVAHFHMAGWLMRFLLFACIWLQWFLLDALHSARVKFPALDGEPYLCTYGQDTGASGPPPRGPNGVKYEQNRANIDPDYGNVVMRNALAKVLKALNMDNEEIGPVDYGMESASCRFACVVVLSLWVLKTLLLECALFHFLVRIPKMVRDDTGLFCERLHWQNWRSYCTNFHQFCNVFIPPIFFFVLGCWGTKMAFHTLIYGWTQNLQMWTLYLITFWVPVAIVINLVVSIAAPHGDYSWVCPEGETENCVRSLENAMMVWHEKKDFARNAEWKAVRKNLKEDLRSLLGKKNTDRITFAPRSLPHHFFWCEVLPFFSLRLFVIMSVSKQGLLILMNTGAILDLILNSLAITFLLEFEKLLYHIFSDKHVHHVMENLQPVRQTNFVPAKQAIPLYRSDDLLLGREHPALEEWEEVVPECDAEWENTVWTIESISVQYEKEKVDGTLKRALSSETKSFNNVKFEDFDKRFKLVTLGNERFFETHEDTPGDEKDEPADSHWRQVLKTCWSHILPILCFIFVVLVVVFGYLHTHCELKLAPFTFEDRGNPYFFGDTRIAGGWMTGLGQWISKNVTWNDETTCAPYRESASGVVEMNVTGCGTTPDPTSLPWG